MGKAGLTEPALARAWAAAPDKSSARSCGKISSAPQGVMNTSPSASEPERAGGPCRPLAQRKRRGGRRRVRQDPPRDTRGDRPRRLARPALWTSGAEEPRPGSHPAPKRRPVSLRLMAPNRPGAEESANRRGPLAAQRPQRQRDRHRRAPVATARDDVRRTDRARARALPAPVSTDRHRLASQLPLRHPVAVEDQPGRPCSPPASRAPRRPHRLDRRHRLRPRLD